MSGCVVQVWFEEDDGQKRPPGSLPPFQLVETEFADFADFSEAVAADMLISGDNLWTRKGDVQGERTIYRRSPILFRGSTLKRAALPTWRLVEEVPE